MKICFDNCSFGSKTGPSTFASRLAEQFYALGHEISNASSHYDIMLSFIQRSQNHRTGSKLVQRLDGIWFKPENFALNNKTIKDSYDLADLVVFQSEFDKKMNTKWFGEAKKSTVIKNGINIQPCTEFKSPDIARIRQKFDKIFVCSANWHPQKRLKSNIKMFNHCRGFYRNSCLFVLGNTPDCYVSDQSIFYTGSLPKELYLEIFAAANWMLHLAWLDHCPNTVVESLSQETHVICSESGGTKELVQDFGIILSEKNPYDFTLEDYDNPPDIDVTQVTQEMLEKPKGNHANIDIVDVAKAYIDEFELLLSR